MTIIARNDGGNFEPHPEGQYPAICCDVVDLGMVRVEYGGKAKEQHKIRVVFQTNSTNPETRRSRTTSQRFTLSLHEKANLRKFLEAWRGKAYTEAEAKAGVDIELMVGVHALLQITHATKNGKTYDNISSIMRLPKGMVGPETDPGYVRVKDRTPAPEAGAGAPGGDAPPDEFMDDDDGLPF